MVLIGQFVHFSKKEVDNETELSLEDCLQVSKSEWYLNKYLSWMTS